jgi:hypothetical protein
MDLFWLNVTNEMTTQDWAELIINKLCLVNCIVGMFLYAFQLKLFPHEKQFQTTG